MQLGINPFESLSRKPALRLRERHLAMQRILRRSILAAVVAAPLISPGRAWAEADSLAKTTSATSVVGNLDHSSSKDQQPTVDPRERMIPRPATMAIVATGLLGIVGAGLARRRRRRS